MQPGSTLTPQGLRPMCSIKTLLPVSPCAAANGVLIKNDRKDVRDLSSAEVLAILNEKYPNRNNSNPGIGGAPSTQTTWTTGNYINETEFTPATGANNINWCKLPYNPLSSTPLGTLTRVGFQSGEFYGQTPQSVLDWIKCFNASVPAAEVTAGRAAYACIIDDVKEGGTIEGFTRYQAPRSGGRGSKDAPGMVLVLSMGALLGAGYIAGIAA
jgi:hypothetical protein